MLRVALLVPFASIGASIFRARFVKQSPSRPQVSHRRGRVSPTFAGWSVAEPAPATAVAFVVFVTLLLGLANGDQVAAARANSAASSPFLVTRAGDTYHADSQSTTSSYTGTLKSVVEGAVAELELGGGGTVEFDAGTFDFGTEYLKLQQIHNVTFQGKGIDVTFIQNSTDALADTEPFNLSGAFGVTIRDMTVSAGGAPRPTSDAIDFDEGNDSVVERVKITASRGRGIIFDGKNAGWTSEHNVVRDCVIDGVADSGVEFLASSNNLIEGCTITNTARHGIEAGKSSPLAPQPNKKSDNNAIRNNVIDNAGIDGIFVSSGDGNRIENNRITNSGNNVAAADGVRITSADSITCDDNLVDGNVATDTQAAKTQRYGLNIASSLCNRTRVGGGNDFIGNRVAAINDLGTATEYGADTLPPTAPSGLVATAVYKTQIDLTWSPSSDSVGVTAYEIWRNGSLLTTIGVQTTYTDTTVSPDSTHSYEVRATDAAGNLSAFSNTATATTPAGGRLFHEGFESGDLSAWTANGLTVQQQELLAGSWAARATGANSAAYATKQFAGGESNLYWQAHFKVLSQSTNVNLLRFRTAANAALLTVFVTTTNRLGYRNEVAALSTTSTASATRGVWHTLQVHVRIAGDAGETEVWLDGEKVAALSKAEALGTNAIGRFELGDSTTIHAYDVAFDEVEYDRELITDANPPTAPSSLVATPHSGFRIDLSWTASSDDSGVAAYEIYRDDALLTTVSGTATSYADTAVAPLTSYAYKVRAKDGSGNTSDFSNMAFATTGDAFADTFETGDLSRWTGVSGLTVQQAVVDRGQWAAWATSDGTAGSSAQVQLDSPVDELYYRVRFRIAAQGINSVSLLRFRTAQNGALASAFVSSIGKLTYRNDGTGIVTTSGQSVSKGAWHELQMHVLAGGPSSQVDLWLDGVKVISQPDALASGAIGRLELGDPGLGRSFDVAFDDVVANPIFVADAAAPTPPLALRTTNVAADGIDLAWDAASDDVGVTTYRIKRDGAPVADVDGSTFEYADRGLAERTQYRYTVTALDAVGHESTASNEVVATTLSGRPDPPTGLTAAAVPGENRVDLSWSQPARTAGVTGYRIYRDGSATALASVDGVATTSFADTTVAPVTQYSYQVTTIGSAGQESDPSDAATATTFDTVAPTAPSGVTATAISDVQIDLRWAAGSDNVSVTGYRIFRDGAATPVATVDASTTTFSDTGLTPRTAYTYTVRAFDAAGNASPESSPATATTLKFETRVLTFAPSDDAYVRSSTPTTNAGTATALQIDNSPVKQFLLKFRVAGVGSDRVQSAKLRIYCVDGSDVGGNFYPLADPTAAWDERTVTWNNAPGAGATRLAALGRVVAGQWYEVDVTPLVAGDGAASLRVSSTSTNGADYASKERSGGFASQLIVTVGSSFPDTSPPSEPTNLHVASSTGSQVVLGWTAATDNVGVTNYRIWRNGAVLAATGPATSYTDSTVVASTHYEYRVQALDAAGNYSSLSAPVAIDTAPVLTLTPTADATIRADNPTAVLGAASILDTDASPVKNMLLQFSISGIGSRRVVSAKLRIYCVDGTGAGGDFHRLANPTASWSESSVNWNNAPAADPAIAASLGRVVAGTWYEVDLTSIVTGDGTLNLRITSPSSDGAGYSSKEGTFAPQLVVTTA